MNAVMLAQSLIVLTPSAVSKVKELIKEEGNPCLKLRMFVQGGGCSGFQYGFSLEDIQEADDTAIMQDDVTVLVDCMSLQYLAGATVDYVENLDGAQFVVKNPNAQSSCGCGSSFSV